MNQKTVVSGVSEKGKRFEVRATTPLGMSKKRVDIRFSFAERDDAFRMQELLTLSITLVAERD